ncbi:hypothetical protein ES703_109225 [subsurface metagenome]
MGELLEILKNNFDNNEILRQRFLNKTPKYVNDDTFNVLTLQKSYNDKKGEHKITFLSFTQ